MCIVRDKLSVYFLCAFFIDYRVYVLYVLVVVLSSLYFSFMEREIAMDLDRSVP